MASRSLGTLTLDLAVKTGAYEQGLDRASRATKKRAAEIEKTAKQIGTALGVALTAAAGIAATAIKSAIDRADELSKAAQKIGITTEALSALSYAAQLADVDLATLQGGLARLTKFQNEAAKGTEANVDLFKTLGIEFKNLDGTLRNSEDVFRDFANVFQTLPDGATKTALALEVFGKSGANLIPLLNSGAQGLDDMRERAEALGIVIDTETGKAAEEFNDQLEDLKLAATGLATAVAVELLPDLIALNKEFQDGASSGDGYASTAENLANGLRGVVWVAGKAYDTIRLLTLGIAGLSAKVLEFAATYTPILRSLTTESQRQALSDFSAVSLAGAEEARGDILGTRPAVTGDPMRGSRQGRGAATRDAALEAIRGEEAEKAYAASLGERKRAQEAAAAAAKASAEANRAANQAAREAAKREKEEAEAALKLAERVYEQQKELRDLRAAEAKERQDALKQGSDLVEDLKFELELMKMTNAERSLAIQLRGLDAEAIEKYGDDIKALNEQIEENIRIAEGMDVVRDATEGLFNDLMSGAKSAKDAFMDFVDSILAGIAQIVARNLTESLLGSFGSTNGGAAGGGWASLFAGLFGGARASGGSVDPGRAYLVGEQGPELFVPTSSGNIASNSATRRMGGGVTQNITVIGSVDRRAADRIRIDAAKGQQKAMARTY